MKRKMGLFLFIFLISVAHGAEKEDDRSPLSSSSRILRPEKRDLLDFSKLMDESEGDDNLADLGGQVKQLRKQVGEISRDSIQNKFSINQLESRENTVERELRDINERLKAIEKNIAAVAGTEPVYHRIIRADMVLQLTCICTILNVIYSLASGQGVGSAFMAFVGAYTFYYFFKFIRDAGTVAGNVVFRRSN